MVKKLGSAGMLIGGLMAAIGSIIAVVSGVSEKISSAINMAVLARVGAIITFVAAIIVVAGAVMSGTSKKGGAIAGMVFAVIAFIGQFMINPLTGLKAAASAALGGNAEAAGGAAAIGLVMIAVSGLVCFIMASSELPPRTSPDRKITDKMYIKNPVPAGTGETVYKPAVFPASGGENCIK